MNTQEWSRMNTLLGADTLCACEEQELCKLAKKAQDETSVEKFKITRRGTSGGTENKFFSNETQWSV